MRGIDNHSFTHMLLLGAVAFLDRVVDLLQAILLLLVKQRVELCPTLVKIVKDVFVHLIKLALFKLLDDILK